MQKSGKTVFAIVFGYFLLVELLSEMLGTVGYALSLTFTLFLAYFRPILGRKQTFLMLLFQTIDLEISYMSSWDPVTIGVISMLSSNNEVLHFAEGLVMLELPLFLFLEYLFSLWLVKKLGLRERVGKIYVQNRKGY